jgi:hypothetical protein
MKTNSGPEAVEMTGTTPDGAFGPGSVDDAAKSGSVDDGVQTSAEEDLAESLRKLSHLPT